MLKVLGKYLKKISLMNIIFFFIAIIILHTVVQGCSKEGFENNSEPTIKLSIDNSISSALPKGIKREDIPEGEEDLYIKKTEIVPPVCPRCPDLIQKDIDTSKCPPCPACKRCPAPAEVECKKVFKAKDKNLVENEEIDIDVAYSQTDGSISQLPTTGPLDLMNKQDIKVGSLLTENNKPQQLRPVLTNFSNF
jgi:hypothetical protein